mgnify:CR=1 FL=1
MDEFDVETEADLGLRSDEKTLEKLEGRIARLKEPERKGSSLYAKGIGLVLSFGFVMAGCLIAGVYLGDYLALKAGIPVLKLVGIVIGLVVALTAAVKLLQPFLKSHG